MLYGVLRWVPLVMQCMSFYRGAVCTQYLPSDLSDVLSRRVKHKHVFVLYFLVSLQASTGDKSAVRSAKKAVIHSLPCRLTSARTRAHCYV